MIVLDYRVRRENLILIKVHDYIDNYSGEIIAFCVGTRGRKSINSIPAVRPKQNTSVSMIEALNKQVECNKIEFQGIFSPINIYFLRIHAISIEGRRVEVFLHSTLKRILLKSCECQSKKPLIYSFYHTKTIFSQFFPRREKPKKLSFAQSCLKPPLIVIVTIILESMAFFGLHQDGGQNLKP